MTDICFIIAALLVCYAYIGYPLILLLLRRRYSNSSSYEEALPAITVLIAARNEAAVIGTTIRSLLDVDYPHELLRLIVVSDASTDETDNIVRSCMDDRVELISLKTRAGKYSALQAALPQCKTDILVFADSSSAFQREAIRILVEHFSNPRVGAVTGAKGVVGTGSPVAAGDGLYWRYDAWLRTRETRAGASWVGVEGGFFGIRSRLLTLDFPRHIAADYAIGCRVYEQGYLHIYDPAARISELPSGGMRQEFRRKIRVIVRGIQALVYFRHLLNPLTHPFFSFQNLSHRLMRWLVPFLLIILLLTSALSDAAFIHATFYAQLAFYLIAVTGGIVKLPRRWSRITNVPWYFLVVNGAAFFSWFLLHRRYETWSPPQRGSVHHHRDEGGCS